MRTALLALMLIVAAGAQAQTRLAVDVGWSDVAKTGRWCPIYLTVSDSVTREASLEIVAPHDDRSATHLRQLAAIGQAATTYAMFLPAAQKLDSTAVLVCDAATGRTLASVVLGNRPAKVAPLKLLGAGDRLVGISGRAETTRLVQARLNAAGIANGILSTELLPTVPLGYDALDLLILSSPDLNSLTVEQQQAIVAWVERGGVLLLSPGNEPLPRETAILDALPCKLGDNRTYTASPPQIGAAGMKSAEPVDGRALHPAAFAEAIDLFGAETSDGIPAALGRRLGFGRVVVVPADLGQLRFVDNARAAVFWRRAMSLILQDSSGTPTAQPAAEASRESTAIEHAVNAVGPPTESHGFLPIAFMLIGLSAIVGPVDWVVLKALGARPWTWTTTIGWVALACVIVADVMAERRPARASGDPVRVIDQADDQALATTEVAPADKASGGSSSCWQQPAGDSISAVVGRGLRSDVRFRQDRRGNQYEEIMPHDGSPLLRTQIEDAEPPVLDATLNLRDGRLFGTITNRGREKLSDIIVRCAAGVAAVSGDLGAGGSATVDAAVVSGKATAPDALADLAILRSLRIDRLLAADHSMACVDAKVGDGRTQVRALVRLSNSK